MLSRLALRVFEVALTGVVFTVSSSLTKKCMEHFYPEEEEEKEEKETTTTATAATPAEPPSLL